MSTRRKKPNGIPHFLDDGACSLSMRDLDLLRRWGCPVERKRMVGHAIDQKRDFYRVSIGNRLCLCDRNTGILFEMDGKCKNPSTLKIV